MPGTPPRGAPPFPWPEVSRRRGGRRSDCREWSWVFPLGLKILLRREEDPLRVAFTDAEDLADLGVREPFDLEQCEDAAALLRELVEELAEGDALRVVDARRSALDPVVDGSFLDPAFAFAEHVVAGVDEDAEQPCRE